MADMTRAQVRQLDQLAIESLGVSGLVLMENAGRQLADAICRTLEKPDQNRPVCLICGSGNNGGDAYVAARHLHLRGMASLLYATRPADQLTGDAKTNAAICQRLGITCHPLQSPSDIEEAAATWANAPVLVDALLGTGFTGQVREPLAQIIQTINRVRAKQPRLRVIAVDIPSGLDADTGQPANATIQADLTITFAARKIGFNAPQAHAYTGRIEVADIGIPTTWPAQ